MLQRIQSVWLFLAAIFSFAGFKYPFYNGINVSGEQSYVLKGSENFGFIILTAGIAALALTAIFLYKNRKLQLRLSILALVMQIGLLVMYIYYTKKIFVTSPYNTYTLWVMIQPIVLVLLVLAVAGIRKDEKIIKESNRLR